MSIALPIVEQITLDVLKTLQGVATATGSGVTLWVERATRQGNTAQPGRISAFVKEHDPLEDGSAPQLHRQWMQPYSVALICFESDKSQYPARQTLQIAAAEAQRAMRKDPQRGGLAINTIFQAPVWFDDVASTGGKDGLILVFNVQYRHRINDPFTI